MTITFQQTIQDLHALQEYLVSRSKTIHRAKIIVLILLPLFFVPSLLFDFNTTKLVLFSLLSLLWVLFYWKRFEQMVVKGRMRTLKKQAIDNILGPMTIDLHDDYFLVKRKNSESKVNWAGILSFEEIKEYVFLNLNDLQAFVIPKSAVSKEAMDFLRMKFKK